MANKDPSKTEDATDKKIEDARKDGTVHSSPDVLSFGVMLVGFTSMIVFVPYLAVGFLRVLNGVLSVDCRESWDTDSLIPGGILAALTVAKYTIPIMIAVVTTAIIVMRIQVGKYFSLKAAKFKFESLNPKNGMKQLAPSKKNIIKLLITMSKLSVVGTFVYYSIVGEFENLLSLTFRPLFYSANWIGTTIVILVYKILGVLFILAIIDYIVKKKEYMDNLMMTKQEIKDEHKGVEGNPEIKAKIRQKMQALMQSRMISELPTADVVITNPTHVAIAIRYDMGSYAPKVIGKGLRKRALSMKEMAKDYDIPIIEAPPLARSLYRNTKAGEFIAPEFFGAVAAILAKIHNKKRMKLKNK